MQCLKEKWVVCNAARYTRCFSLGWIRPLRFSCVFHCLIYEAGRILLFNTEFDYKWNSPKKNIRSADAPIPFLIVQYRAEASCLRARLV